MSQICVAGVRRVKRPRIGRIGRIGRIRRIQTDLIRAYPSDPPNPWSTHPSDLASCLTQLDSNTRIGHYPILGFVKFMESQIASLNPRF